MLSSCGEDTAVTPQSDTPLTHTSRREMNIGTVPNKKRHMLYNPLQVRTLSVADPQHHRVRVREDTTAGVRQGRTSLIGKTVERG